MKKATLISYVVVVLLSAVLSACTPSQVADTLEQSIILAAPDGKNFWGFMTFDGKVYHGWVSLGKEEYGVNIARLYKSAKVMKMAELYREIGWRYIRFSAIPEEAKKLILEFILPYVSNINTPGLSTPLMIPVTPELMPNPYAPNPLFNPVQNEHK